MSENRLPEFESISELVEFFDTNDLGRYDLPEVEFDIHISKRTFLVEVDKELMKKLSRAAKENRTSTEALINTWLEERVESVA
jgi:hypothetical protein